jgi:branched-subunit amino acid aminotransferase/4-amino-4-deoxychorismate lyase
MLAACLDPKIKSLNYLNNILAKIEANRAGMDEALMLNLEGHVCEGSVDNIFIVSEGELVTPPLSDGMLAGITRRVIIEAATENGIPCRQASLRAPRGHRFYRRLRPPSKTGSRNIAVRDNMAGNS